MLAILSILLCSSLLEANPPCSDVSLRTVNLTSSYTTLNVDEGVNLQLVPDETLLAGSELFWQSSGSPISEYQSFLPCSEQDPNVVVDEKGRDLLMINLDETSAVQRIYASNGSRTISVQMKINRKSMEATDVSAALKWIGILFGFFIIMIVFIVVVLLMKKHNQPHKKANESQISTKNEIPSIAKDSTPDYPIVI